MDEEELLQIYNYELDCLRLLELDHEVTAELTSRLNIAFNSECWQMLVSCIEYLKALEKAIKASAKLS